MTRTRSFQPPDPLPEPSVHGTRRNTGGARREATERVTLRAPGFETAGWTLNVSRGGVRLVVEDRVEPGVEIEIIMGQDGTQSRRGRVVWVQDETDGQIAGVQFLDGEGSVPPPDATPRPR
jgi:hypothetical protein